MVDLNAIDLFAGAGGWDLAAGTIGFDPLGIEIDAAACATREAAGLRTVEGDVAALDPDGWVPAGGSVDLVIASPPCPTYSSAGNGGGRHLTEIVVRCMHELAAGNDTRKQRRLEAYQVLQPIYRQREDQKAAEKERESDWVKANLRARRDADMSLLVVEPLRWVLALEPRFIALEQVPEVLPLWSEMAQVLGTLGYSTWIGVLTAEAFGVPQTRKRAILMADREEQVRPPAPTHQRYVKRPDRATGEPTLFEAPKADRYVLPEDRDLLPWVSMSESLGWESSDRVGFPRADARGVGGYRERDRRPATEPAFTVSEKARSVTRVVYDRRQTGGDGTPIGPRSVDEPAPTLQAQGPAKGRDVWATERPAPTIVTTRRSKDGILVGRQLPEGEGENVGGHNWPKERPSTTVNGDPRISKPGRHDPEESGSQQKDAIRVTLEEALVLQSFSPDYPVQGTKSQRYLQIGNAVPPLLAKAILSQLLKPVLGLEHSMKEGVV